MIAPEQPVIAGALHYFRVHPDQWRDRIHTLRHMGLDTIETYVPWNLHEPVSGEYEFDGFADLGRFLDEIAEAGMRAIVRPGPYICAEWENGGLPAWLTADPGIRVRTSDPRFLSAVDRWFDVLMPLIVARQASFGGPVTMVQVENEYGSFGSDTSYLEHLRDGLRSRGVTEPLFTSDGSIDIALVGGTVDGASATVNFGSRSDEAFAQLAKHRPLDEPFCMEFWNGWFDHWGNEYHGARAADDAAAELDRILSAGGSVNIYMAHGGTNFGCTAGANHDGRYRPTVTSYDYDAPLDEAGRPTEKYWAYREVIAAYRPLPETSPPPQVAMLPATSFRLEEAVDVRAVFRDVASSSIASPFPPTYEELGLVHGLVRYQSRLGGPVDDANPLGLPRLADRAHVYIDGELRATLDRDDDTTLALSVPAEGADLEIIVESMGRINYGPLLGEPKGLVGGVLHHTQFVHGWTVETIPFSLMPDLPTIPWESGRHAVSDAPTWRRGSFELEATGDTFLALEGWGKGYVWINGFCLGRYWQRGPQRTLYVPAPVLKIGSNEIVVLELDGVADPVVELRPQAELGSTR